MKKLILDTPNAKIYQQKEGYVVYMKMKDGKWLVNHPHSGDLKGLIASLTLSIDVLAGKVWPMSVVDLSEKKNSPVEYVMPQLTTGSLDE